MKNNVVLSTVGKEVDLDLFKPTTKPEATGLRPLVYSRWHRTLKEGTYCTNLDWIEWRNGKKTVALIEEKPFSKSSEMKHWKKEIITDMIHGLRLLYRGRNPKFKGKIRAYVVYHNLESAPNDKDSWIFELVDLETGISKRMQEPQYRRFLENL